MLRQQKMNKCTIRVPFLSCMCSAPGSLKVSGLYTKQMIHLSAVRVLSARPRNVLLLGSQQGFLAESAFSRLKCPHGAGMLTDDRDPNTLEAEAG